jgi:type IV secretory pathway TrbL component
VGPLVIAFTPLSWTFEMLLIWGRSLLGMAFKTALILMTLAVGMSLANTWIANFQASSTTFTTDIWNLLIAVVEAMLFAFAVWRLPNSISGLAGGAAIVGFGEALLSTGAAWASGGGSSNDSSGDENGGGSGGSGGGGGGSSTGSSSGDGRSGSGQPPSPTAQELAAKVQTALLKG